MSALDETPMDITADRRSFLAYFSGLGLASTLFPGVLWAKISEEKMPSLTRATLRAAAQVAGLDFTDEQLDRMLKGVTENTVILRELRQIEIDNSVAPPFYFNPVLPGMKLDRTRRPFRPSPPPRVSRPRNLEDAAFWPVTQLAELLRTRQVTSVELTEMYLARIRRYNPKLKCVVTLTDDLALRQARQADKEIASGHYRGPLHGIPYGVKDLFAVKGYPTT
jgi:hypothetical protein